VFGQAGDLVGSGAVSNDLVGSGVALSSDGDTAIVSVPGDNGAWVFVRSDGRWVQQGPMLGGSGGGPGAEQGGTVALSGDGDTALIGGYGLGVSVFVRSDGTWAQQAELGPPLRGDDNYSVSLSYDGNTALVGEPEGQPGEPGRAEVFTRSGTSWSEQAALVGTGASGAEPNGEGWSVALSADGNTALVGDPLDASPSSVPALPNNDGVGAAWIYTRSGTTWTQQGPKLVGSGRNSQVGQGYSVALSADGDTALTAGPGNTGLAGGPGETPNGAAWVFVRNGSGWTQQGPRLTTPRDVMFSGEQGLGVALSADGNTALIGTAQQQGNPGVPAGGAWIWDRLGTVWTERPDELVGPGGQDNEVYSVALSADGNLALLGAPFYRRATGAAWLFAPAPTVSISSPTPHGIYAFGERVRARYACQEGVDGPGIQSCDGTIPDDTVINTTAPGRHAFTVTTQSIDGEHATSTVHYTVLASNKFTLSNVEPHPNGTTNLEATIPGPGTVDVMETAWLDDVAVAAGILQPAPRRFVIARAHMTSRHATKMRIRVTLNSPGRALLRHHRYRVVFRLWVSYLPRGGRQRNVGIYGLHFDH
jgi:hypothetical protein